MPRNALLGPRWNQLALEPTGTRIGWTSTLDGPAPDSLFAEREQLFWAVRVPEVTDIELASGPRLKDLPGSVSIAVGAATPVGKRPSNDGTPRWGTMVLDSIDNPKKGAAASRFYVDLHVAPELFERLRALLASGFVPRLSLLIPQEVSPDVEPIGFRDPYVGDTLVWDNVKHPVVPIDWCTFEYALPDRGSEDTTDHPTTANRPATQQDILVVARALETATQRYERRAL